MSKRRERRLAKARRPVTVRAYSLRLNSVVFVGFLLLQGAMLAFGAAFSSAMLGEPFFEDGRFKYLAEIDTSSGDVVLRRPTSFDGSYESFVAWTSEARETCTPFVFVWTIASDLSDAGLVGDFVTESYEAWARAEGIPADNASFATAVSERVGSDLALPVRTFVCIRGGGEPLGHALSAGLLQRIADAAEAGEPRLSAYLRANEESLNDAFFSSGAMLANAYTLPVLTHPSPAIAWRAVALYTLAGLLAIAGVLCMVVPGIRAFRMPRSRWRVPKAQLVCPRCALALQERPEACPECRQRLMWPEPAPS